MEIQTIEERYVDMKKLLKLLKNLFGDQKCEIEVCYIPTFRILCALTEAFVQVQEEYIILTVPRLLTEVHRPSMATYLLQLSRLCIA